MTNILQNQKKLNPHYTRVLWADKDSRNELCSILKVDERTLRRYFFQYHEFQNPLVRPSMVNMLDKLIVKHYNRQIANATKSIAIYKRLIAKLKQKQDILIDANSTNTNE